MFDSDLHCHSENGDVLCQMLLEGFSDYNYSFWPSSSAQADVCVFLLSSLMDLRRDDKPDYCKAYIRLLKATELGLFWDYVRVFVSLFLFQYHLVQHWNTYLRLKAQQQLSCCCHDHCGLCFQFIIDRTALHSHHCSHYWTNTLRSFSRRFIFPVCLK